MSFQDIANALDGKTFTNYSIKYAYVPITYQSFSEGSGSSIIYHGTAYPYSDNASSTYGTNGTFHTVDATAGIVSITTDYGSIDFQILGSNTSGSLLFLAENNGSQIPIRIISAQPFASNSTNIGSYSGVDPTHYYDSRNNFNISQINHNSFSLVDTACFAAGTRIGIPGGSKAVEDLAIGDIVLTPDGEEHRVRWLGSRRVAPRFQPDPATAYPICVRAEAFGRALPEHDLLLSPAHGVCIDLLGKVIVPIGLLVNGATIERIEVETIDYWHVELDRHEILVANGLPAESYLDDGNRSFFADAPIVSLFAKEGRGQAEPVHPYIREGLLLEAIWQRLAARAEALGWRRETPSLVDSVGMLAGRDRIAPEIDGLTCRFSVPGDAGDLTLVSTAVAPRWIAAGADDRRLGLCLSGLRFHIADRTHGVALDHPALGAGLHHYEEAGWRWTDGRMTLPETLLPRCEGGIIVEIELASLPLPVWIAPDTGDAARLRGARQARCA